MIRPITLAELAAPLQADIYGSRPDKVSFTRVNTDSRNLQAGDLFVALKGERFDAHDYLQQVVAAGACGLVVEARDSSIRCPQVVVADTTRALGQIAALNRDLYTGPLVALTGSSGKTTTKEMLAKVLSGCGRVHVTAGNLNNHIGVPKTLLAMSAGIDYAVIEMGASGPGEIAYLAALARPTVALVTNVMAAHMQGFGSLAGVAREKSSIYLHLQRGGVAVLNIDVPQAGGWIRELQEQRPDIRRLSYSLLDPSADVSATDIRLLDSGCYQFQLNTAAGSAAVTLPVLGRQNVANALAVSACSLALGLSLEAIVAGLQAVAAVPGRMYPRRGLHGALLVDDSYNANPGSVMAAATLLQDFQRAGRDTLLVLGDLAELGDNAEATLAALGADIQTLGLPRLATLGDNSCFVGEGFKALAGSGQTATHFSTRDTLIEFIKQQLTNNSVVLVKGSRSARMEGVVQAIAPSGDDK